MTKREYLQTLEVKKLTRNGLIAVTTERDMRIFDAFSAFSSCFEAGTMTKQQAIEGVASANKLAERTVRKIVSEMRAVIV
jgi:hypothetical protein